MNPQGQVNPQTKKAVETKGFVYCPICTHTVEAIVVANGKSANTKPGQKCSRCSASLDPAYIMRMDRAA